MCLVEHRDAVRYCFGPVVTKQLADLVIEWNHHRVRKTATAEAPGGIPEVLYFSPNSSGICVHVQQLCGENILPHGSCCGPVVHSVHVLHGFHIVYTHNDVRVRNC